MALERSKVGHGAYSRRAGLIQKHPNAHRHHNKSSRKRPLKSSKTRKDQRKRRVTRVKKKGALGQLFGLFLSWL